MEPEENNEAVQELAAGAPAPRRGPPIQGHWAERTEQSYEVEQEDEVYASGGGGEGYETEERQTPRQPSEAGYSRASSLPSEAPEFYEEEPVTLSRIEEVLAIEHGLREACRTLPITMASWIFFTLLIFYHGQVQGSFDCANTIRESMLMANVPAVNNSVTLRELRIGTITERYDIIQWIQLGLVPTMTTHGLKHGQLRRTQQLLGKVRVTQTRSVPKDCGMDSSLSSFYAGSCHPPGGTPQAFGTSKLDYAMMFEPYNLGSEKNKFVAWLDIGRSLSTLDNQFKAMLEFGWLDDNTQDVTIDAMFLNPELNVYSKMVIHFSLHRGGWIQQDIFVTPIRGDVYYHWAIIWMDAMWITIMFFLMWQACVHAYEEIHKGLFWWWITDLFVIFDMLSVIGGAGIALYFWQMSIQIDQFVQKASTLGFMPTQNGIEAVMVWKTRYILQNWKYEKNIHEIIANFDTVADNWLTILCLTYTLIIVCRFYRGFTGQPRIAVILQTMSAVAMFLLHYLIVFCIIMANFIVSGYVLFGEEIQDWSTLGKATCSSLLMLFGRFDYNDFHAVAPVSAAIWFTSFFVILVLVITGLTTSTILHHYLLVRTKTGQAGDSIIKQIWQMYGDLCYGRTYDGAQKSLPPDKLFEMVTLDTDPLRIRHLGRFNIDRRMRTRHDVHEAELDPKVDVEFLIGRGMDPITAERLLYRIAEQGHHIKMRSSPVHRLTLFIARQMSMLRFGAEHMRKKTTDKVTWASKSVDRVDLKHAKCVGLAKRIRRAQELPPGWTQHEDSNGRRYLRQEETGLTSWTLPRHLI